MMQTPAVDPIADVLLLLAKRGREIRLAREQQTADTVQPGSVSVSAAATPHDDAGNLIHYDSKILAVNAADGGV